MTPSLRRTYKSILEDARGAVAGGSPPDWRELETRIRDAAERARERTPDREDEIEASEHDALERLAKLNAVHRARALVTAPAPAPPPPQPRRRAAFRARPTLAGNMELQRKGGGTLAWPPAAGVAGWEIRISGRADARSEYAVRETHTLPPAATSVELELGATPLRVHVLGRAADGRLVRRAIASGLTEDNWGDRWQRRPSAS